MTAREGGSPDGEAPDRVAGAGMPPESSQPPLARPGTPPGPSAQQADPAAPAEPRAQQPGPATPVDPLAPQADPATAADPLAPFQPSEPTFRAEPAVREFEVPFDTGQLQSISTGQLLIVHRPGLDPVEEAEEQTQRRVYSWVAAVVGTIGAAASLFVGWMLPLSIAALVFGVLGLRREEHGRTLAFVGIGTGLAGLVFSAVWIGYYAIVFGALPR
ncbi:hypothetical protein ACFCVO_06605 [Agromyces sp. NPDC056379]|uniref:DUF4190 domain-containing protein n=1 Tax=unclassified Agromyces TaxID=2639701 RepID=UPI0035DEC4B2